VAHRERKLGITSLALGASALMACGNPAGEVESATLSRAEQPILGGSIDRAHPEVMLLLDRAGFLCTGTVIHVEQRTGFLLTAAHCVTQAAERGPGVVPIPADQFMVVPGEDFAESTTAFSVNAVHVEPSYDGSFAADVAVVRFSFGNEAPPGVLRPLGAADDELAVDAELELVGYGQTESDEANTQRRSVDRNIQELDDEVVIYDQEDGSGACFGDSGGPALVRIDGAERVAAVISGGVFDAGEECSGIGVAMRVSAYEGFIQAALAARSD
jgi:secreted trypsin-like serine protease